MLGQKQTSTSVGFQPSPFISRVDVFFHLEAFPPRSIVQPFWQRSHFYGLSVAKLTFLFCFASWAVEAKTNIVTWTMNNHDIFIAQTECRGIFLWKSHLKSILISPGYGFHSPHTNPEQQQNWVFLITALLGGLLRHDVCPRDELHQRVDIIPFLSW